LEIRARIGLEVAKFQANAKIVAAQFKAMGTNAEKYQNNVDYFARRSLDLTKNLNSERVQDVTKTGQAIVAREKKIADDRYSLIMQSAKRVQKDRSKLELDAVRPGATGAVTGSVRPPARENPLYKKEADATKILTATMRKEYNAAYEAKERAALKASKVESRENQKRISEGKKITDQMHKQREAVIRAARELEKLSKSAQKEEDFRVKVDFFMNDEDFNRRLAATRYALYDIGNRAMAFGLAVAAGMGAAVKAAIDFESAFTSVERTAQVDLGSPYIEAQSRAINLRNALIDISTTIPVAFGQVTEIATLGAQLGIATDDLDEFTETVARFSAITGISVDQAALSFGRLSELLNVEPAQFENLSSAIVFAGINAVATDAEILKMSESIAAASTQAGIAAADTVGFATALASLKVRPEEARGVITRLFKTFDLAISEGGERLDDYAKVLNTTSDQAAALWQQDPSQFVQSFLSGAEATGKLNETMTALGVVNTRELNVITRLANNMDVLEQSLADSNEQFLLGSFSTEAYGKVSDDLASKIIILQNSITAMGASIGETVTGPLADFVTFLTSITEEIRKSPEGVRIFIAAITALTAGLSIFIALLTLGTAGLLALKLAFQNLSGGTVQANISLSTFRALVVSMIPNAAGATTVLGGLSTSFKAVAAGATGAGIAARGFATVASVAFGPVGIAVGLLSTLGLSLMAFSSEAEKSKKAMFESAGGIDAVLDAAARDAASGAEPFREINVALKDLNEEEQNSIEIQKNAIASRESSKGKFIEQTEAVKNAIEGLQDYEGAVNNATDAVDGNTIALGNNVAALILDSLGSYDADGSNFWAKITELSPQIESTLNALGFEAADMVAAGLEEGGETAEGYAERFQTAMRLVAESTGDLGAPQLETYRKKLSELGFEMTTAELLKMNRQLATSGPFLSNQIAFLSDAGAATDNFTDSSVQAAIAADKQGAAATKLGLATEEVEGEVLDLNDALRAQVKDLTASEIAENRSADALEKFAESARETQGALEGTGAAARENLTNFTAFMNAATEAAVEAGEGTPGAIKRIIAGLNSLGESGINTSGAFEVAKSLIITSVSGIMGADAALRTQLGTATDLAGMRAIINGFYATRLAAEGWSNNLMLEWGRAISMLSATGPAIQLPPIKINQGAVKTALQKLQEQIQKAFKALDIRSSLESSLTGLGDSLRQGGKGFAVFSESGRKNISSLQGVIDDLAVKSGGNVKNFANDLASLRAALVRSGVGADGLKLIDTALKGVGTRGKASKKVVDAFTASIQRTASSQRGILALADAFSRVSSSIRSALSARFVGVDALDNATLGWLDIADAAQAARDRINEATQSIADANAEINKLGSDKKKLEYQLQIAIKYGDTLRAADLRSQIAAIETEVATQSNAIAKASSEISAANSQLGIGENQNPRDVIERNKTLRDMAGRYADVAAFMMLNAKPGENLTKIIDGQVAAFKANAIEMGFTEEQAGKVAGVLREELIVAMKQVPKELKTIVKAETSAALKSIDTFSTQATDRLNKIPRNITTTHTVVQSQTATMPNRRGFYPGEISNGHSWNASTSKWTKIVKAASGGFIQGPGSSMSDSIPAMLSNGEFVVRASAVSAYGLDFMNALNQQRVSPSSGVLSSSAAQSGPQLVYLSPEDRQLLRTAIDRPVNLYTDNATIAKSANDGNKILAQRGLA
jgi:TP901 family phage tail tape measure protein